VPGPRTMAPAPPFTTSPFGLITAADPVANPPEHWQNGVNYQPFCADAEGTYDECMSITGSGNVVGAPSPPAYLTNVVDATTRASTAFTVAVEFDCSAVGNNEAEANTRAAFASVESWAVERAVWTGVIPGQSAVTVFPHLAANAAINDVTSSPPLSIVVQTSAIVITGVGAGDKLNAPEGLGLLEEALGNCYQGVGIIHVPELALDTLAGYGLVTQRGARLYTPNGNKISAGAGYPGTSPAGVARSVDTQWIYATGNMAMIRGDVQVRASGPQAFDKIHNTIKMIAERRYVLYWDCCHLALSLALGAPKGT